MNNEDEYLFRIYDLENKIEDLECDIQAERSENDAKVGDLEDELKEYKLMHYEDRDTIVEQKNYNDSLTDLLYDAFNSGYLIRDEVVETLDKSITSCIHISDYLMPEAYYYKVELYNQKFFSVYNEHIQKQFDTLIREFKYRADYLEILDVKHELPHPYILNKKCFEYVDIDFILNSKEYNQDQKDQYLIEFGCYKLS